MTPYSRCRLVRAGFVFLLFVIALWPSFVLISTGMGYWLGDGVTVERFSGEPRRLMLQALMQGFFSSLPQATVVALLATGLVWLFSRRYVVLMSAGLVVSIILMLAFLLALPFSLVNLLIFSLVALEFLLFLLIGGYWMRRCRQ